MQLAEGELIILLVIAGNSIICTIVLYKKIHKACFLIDLVMKFIMLNQARQVN